MNPNNTQNSVIDQIVPDGILGNGLAGTLNQLFYVGLVVTVALALAMVIRGGIQYMTTDGGSGKGDAKKRIQAALGGLVLAFSAILILNTINPGLTRLDISSLRTPIQGLDANGVPITGGPTSGTASSTRPGGTATPNGPQGPAPAGVTANGQRIYNEAYNAIGTFETCSVTDTNGGRRACAYAVNEIVERAIGTQVGGGLSTAAMYTALQNSGSFTLVGSSYSQALPGDIIISPTSGSNTGHVGIAGSAGATTIISNSSSRGVVDDHQTPSSWNRNYGDLGVYIYRPN